MIFTAIDRSTAALLLLGISKPTPTTPYPPPRETSSSRLTSCNVLLDEVIGPVSCLFQLVPAWPPTTYEKPQVPLSCMLDQTVFPFRRQNINETFGKFLPQKTIPATLCLSVYGKYKSVPVTITRYVRPALKETRPSQ